VEQQLMDGAIAVLLLLAIVVFLLGMGCAYAFLKLDVTPNEYLRILRSRTPCSFTQPCSASLFLCWSSVLADRTHPPPRRRGGGWNRLRLSLSRVPAP
jgi:hypothetical protein